MDVFLQWREAMARATIRSALDGILRRSEFLEQVYAVFLQPICSALPTLRDHSTERKTKKLKLTGTALKQPKTAGNKSVTQNSQSKSFLFDIYVHGFQGTWDTCQWDANVLTIYTVVKKQVNRVFVLFLQTNISTWNKHRTATTLQRLR